MAGLVIDASVAVKWFLEEDRSKEARTVLVSEVLLTAPFTILAEVAQALWIASRKARTTATAAESASIRMAAIFPNPVFDFELFEASRRLMHSHNHPIYDCLYLALAERTGSPLVTADEQQFAVARRARIKARLL